MLSVEEEKSRPPWWQTTAHSLPDPDATAGQLRTQYYSRPRITTPTATTSSLEYPRLTMSSPFRLPSSYTNVLEKKIQYDVQNRFRDVDVTLLSFQDLRIHYGLEKVPPSRPSQQGQEHEQAALSGVGIWSHTPTSVSRPLMLQSTSCPVEMPCRIHGEAQLASKAIVPPKPLGFTRMADLPTPPCMRSSSLEVTDSVSDPTDSEPAVWSDDECTAHAPSWRNQRISEKRPTRRGRKKDKSPAMASLQNLSKDTHETVDLEQIRKGTRKIFLTMHISGSVVHTFYEYRMRQAHNVHDKEYPQQVHFCKYKSVSDY